ncbi:class I SAM-dependent methyltransferase [Actinoplanes sp. NBRC 101535]|uniref:class I SAM-dependent methyltransferase n=1 Tax=Actinoplanes sp. NBRC 101535 TaxID=3032196 RepID=UPI0024A1E606|nr:class I SAM-dependent methyltransferase [Actinoplanes sp. NBRC 101535]GLY08435.1 SAM-dependent methyltransferase [Actinoplanes sp. NBRC 101535]
MTAQDRINDYWTGRAPAYDAYQQRPERRAADEVAWSGVWKDALPAGPLDVLDVGTGSGQVAMTLAGIGHRVTGIDLSEGMLERARAHAATAANAPGFRLGDAVAPDFPDASFDAVVNRYVMWTLRDPETALANWIRLLRPGGTVAVIDSTWFTDRSELGFYDEEIQAALPLAAATSIHATEKVLRAAGLHDVTVTALDAIRELDETFGVAPGHHVLTQYLITGRRLTGRL